MPVGEDTPRNLSVGLVSALLLALELLHTRVLSVVYWHHWTYFVITLGMLGIAASGSLLSAWPRLARVGERDLRRYSLYGFSASAWLGLLAVCRLAPLSDFFHTGTSWSSLALLVASYALITPPYFFFGLVVCKAFQEKPVDSHRTYFWNLAGSALGCLAFVLLIRPLGAKGLAALIAAAALLPELIWDAGRRLPVAAAAAIILASSWASLTIEPERNKLRWTMFRDYHQEFQEWNPISDVRVLSADSIPTVKAIVYDGDAWTPMFNYGPQNIGAGTGVPPFPRELCFLARAGAPLGRSLVIGSGGGGDVLTAVKYGPADIDAVEINPTVVDMVRTRYDSFLRGTFNDPRIHLNLEDGRGFLSASPYSYDTIAIYAVDSFAALASGAYINAENYLYTIEAFRQYWRHLGPSGVLQISRWFYYPQERETLRAFVTAYEALKAEGVSEPLAHILVLANAPARGVMGYLLISKEGFRPGTAASLISAMAARGTTLVTIFDPTDPARSALDPNPYADFAAAAKTGSEQGFIDRYVFNVEPTSDDSPFFFQYGRWRHVFTPYPTVDPDWDSIHGRWPFLILLTLLGMSAVLVALLVGWPVLKLSRQVKGLAAHAPVLTHVGCLGLGFSFLEMFLVQRCVLFLGHPTYSLAVTLPVLLASAGAGSLLWRTAVSRPALPAALAILAAAGVSLLLVPSASPLVLSLPFAGRVAAVALCIAPLGMLLGMPFTATIAKMDTYPRLIPVAWGLNSGLSVIGTILAVALAMSRGFVFVAACALAVYALGFACLRKWLTLTQRP